MSEQSVSPCAYPGCRDQDGNARLTADVFCGPCQRRFQRLLSWLLLDYVTLRTQMPMPISTNPVRASNSREYGHPREWASDTARDIADCLSLTEDALREHLRQPTVDARRAGEVVRVKAASGFLTARFSSLLDYPDADHVAAELEELHRKIRSRLGLTRFVQRLPIACPFCETWALLRTVGEVQCGNPDCGRVIREEHYDWLTGFVLDQLIKDYDTRETA